MATTTPLDETVQQVKAFHGHLCPGLTMGIRAPEIALREIGPHSEDEEVVAIVETDMCGVDAIQALTGCTFGKGNLIHRDYGKHAYTFIRRSDSRAIRVVSRSGACPPGLQTFLQLGQRIRGGNADAAERERFRALREESALAVLDLAADELFEVHELTLAAPTPARIHTSLPCAACGELTMETRIRRFDGRNLCIPCFERVEAPLACPGG